MPKTTTPPLTKTKNPAPHPPEPDFASRVLQEGGAIAIGARDRLLAALMHDLRSPLNGIQGWVHVLESAATRPEVARRAMDGIGNGVGRQVQIITDLGDTLQVMAGTLGLDIETLALQPVLESALAEVRPLAQSRDIRFDVAAHHSLPNVRADRRRLEQSFNYLLAHLVETASPADVIQVRLEMDGARVRLSAGAETASLNGSGASRVRRKILSPVNLAGHLLVLQGATIVARTVDADGIKERYEVWFPDASRPCDAGGAALRELAAMRAQIDLPDVRFWVMDDGSARVAELHDLLVGLGLLVRRVNQDAVLPAEHDASGVLNLCLYLGDIDDAAPASTQLIRARVSGPLEPRWQASVLSLLVKDSRAGDGARQPV